MPSWQFQLIKIIFQIRRILHPATGVLDVTRERAETETLATNFKTKLPLTFTPVEVNTVPGEWVAMPEMSTESVILYFHGGSYNSGSLASHRSLVAEIAHAAKVRLLHIAYRLAPEHPFPAAVEDATSSYHWLLEHGFCPDQIIVAGDSAGGGLALALLVSLRDSGDPLPAGAVCLSPWTDLTCTGATWKTNVKKELLIDPGSLRASAQVYLGSTDPRSPLASPLFADLHNLPPILIQVGSDELLLSDAQGFAERAQAAGVNVTLQVWDGMQHEWQFGTNYLPESRKAVARIGEFIQNCISSG
jgi:monoterpene epsilon-lactone hydrolase